MPFLLLDNISQLVTLQGPEEPRAGAALRRLGAFKDGAVLIEDETIVAAGLREAVLRHPSAKLARVVDAGGRLALPGFVDSHSHPVFAAPRLKDFESRLSGRSYEEIAAEGGGILSTVDRVRGASEELLARRLLERCRRFVECGTTTLEAKSGYGLDLESELKILRAIRRAQGSADVELVPTFLGAHALPPELEGRRRDYVRRVCEEMIPAVAREGLARFVDVFCETGYFSRPESELVLAAGVRTGLRPKVHAEQLSRSGGSAAAAALGAVSADHLDRAEPADLEGLRAAGVVATLLPASNYFLGRPCPDARRIIESGVPVALATDFNPGTAPCWNMQMVLSLACAQMRMTPEEAIAAATVNGAHALGLGATRGSLFPGKQADLVVFDAEDYRELPYYFGGNLAALVLKKGRVVHASPGFGLLTGHP